MRVDPDFATHWKTQMLCGFLQDGNAGMYLIRLWGHCQVRKCWEFKGLSAPKLEAVCAWHGEPGVLWKALVDAEWVGVVNDGDDVVLVVHEWDTYNTGLLAAWRNGNKGGRRSSPKGSDVFKDEVDQTQGKPTGSPLVSGGQSVGTPYRYDMIEYKEYGQNDQMFAQEVEKKKLDLGVGFDEFWGGYPKKVAKRLAKRAWMKQRCAEKVEQVMGALGLVKETRQWKEGIIPHPATWLNQERWEDELGAIDFRGGSRDFKRDRERGGNGLEEL